MKSPRHRVLMVWYAFPDDQSVQGERDLVVGGTPGQKLAKFLPRHGFDVTVLSSDRFGEARGAVFRAKEAITKDFMTRVIRWTMPEREMTCWVPSAVRLAFKIIDREHTDILLTSSPHVSNHIVGYALHRSYPEIPWVADFRDGWLFEPPGRLRGSVHLNRFLERSVVEGADFITCASPPIERDFRTRYPKRKFRIDIIPNGFDPDDFETVTLIPEGARNLNMPFTILYTGSFQRSSQYRRIEPLLAGFAEASCAVGPGRMRLVIAGELTLEEQRKVDEVKRECEVEALGLLPPIHARSLQTRADLLAVMGGPKRSVLTSKLFEYIGAGQPVLFIGEKCAGADIVRKYNIGTVATEDPSDIATCILERYALSRTGDPPIASDSLAKARYDFSYETLAKHMSCEFHKLLESRA